MKESCNGCGTTLPVGPRLRRTEWVTGEKHEQDEVKHLCVFCEVSSTLSYPRYSAYFTTEGNVLRQMAAMLNVMLDHIKRKDKP